MSTHPKRAGLCSLPPNRSSLGTGAMGPRQDCLLRGGGGVEVQVLSTIRAGLGSGSVGTRSSIWPALS